MRSLTSVFTVPVDHPVFKGHFPNEPIVPGALLLQWVVRAFEADQAQWSIRQIKSIKFLAVAKPGYQCETLCIIDDEKGRVKLECCTANDILFKGTLVLSPR